MGTLTTLDWLFDGKEHRVPWGDPRLPPMTMQSLVKAVKREQGYRSYGGFRVRGEDTILIIERMP